MIITNKTLRYYYVDNLKLQITTININKYHYSYNKNNKMNSIDIFKIKLSKQHIITEQAKVTTSNTNNMFE